MPSYVVIGASRGIGLEFVRQLACKSDAIVFAIVRNPQGSTHLHAAVASLENVHVFSGDVADYATLERAAKQVSDITGGGLDYLIHNAAKLDMSVFNGFDDYMEDMDNDFISAFRVHSLGPIHGITAFLPLLRASHTKKVIVIGSMVAYGMTKAAAHIATTKFAIKLKDEGFVVVTLEPGMVDTSATAPPVQLDALREVLDTFKKETNIHIQTQGQRPEDSQLRVIDGLEAAHNASLYLSHMGGEYRAPG